MLPFLARNNNSGVECGVRFKHQQIWHLDVQRRAFINPDRFKLPKYVHKPLPGKVKIPTRIKWSRKAPNCRSFVNLRKVSAGLTSKAGVLAKFAIWYRSSHFSSSEFTAPRSVLNQMESLW